MSDEEKESDCVLYQATERNLGVHVDHQLQEILEWEIPAADIYAAFIYRGLGTERI